MSVEAGRISKLPTLSLKTSDKPWQIVHVLLSFDNYIFLLLWLFWSSANICKCYSSKISPWRHVETA